MANAGAVTESYRAANPCAFYCAREGDESPDNSTHNTLPNAEPNTCQASISRTNKLAVCISPCELPSSPPRIHTS